MVNNHLTLKAEPEDKSVVVNLTFQTNMHYVFILPHLKRNIQNIKSCFAYSPT